ncbi:UNKNOWN [Stylonychia lemnae]|uniref:Uncharacterized protein n=1 Tax=Stylonychia lemnae TaxID=5949 RepID=A0A078A4J8_STYLE|nr:UNKNOWN [Stylonychia lemnae]|eukprot:CDW77092.1 UNKNOWN [Stylonychia lemnae]
MKGLIEKAQTENQKYIEAQKLNSSITPYKQRRTEIKALQIPNRTTILKKIRQLNIYSISIKSEFEDFGYDILSPIPSQSLQQRMMQAGRHYESIQWNVRHPRSERMLS